MVFSYPLLLGLFFLYCTLLALVPINGFFPRTLFCLPLFNDILSHFFPALLPMLALIRFTGRTTREAFNPSDWKHCMIEGPFEFAGNKEGQI